MDAADLVVSGPDVGRGEENGMRIAKPYEGDEIVAAEKVNGKMDLLQISDASASSEVPSVTEDGDMTELSPREVNSEECKEVGLQEIHHEKTSKEEMSRGKTKTANHLSSKIVGPVGLKKTSSRKEEKVNSNGISTASSHPKQPLLTSTESYNDGKVATGNANKMKPMLTSSTAKKTKPSKFQSVPSNIVSESNDPMEKTKLKPLRKEAQHEMEGDQDSIVSPTDGDVKSHRVGKLPTYGFSFMCNERAEKRKEFYSKLEEKIHAKEVEISNKEAKSKENQETEIKMLRKSLNFKATPLPNFYQEPTPPKVELKKIPITRPKSPKLGRRKSSSGAEVEVDVSQNQNQNHPKGRLDLGEKVSQNKAAKTSSLANPEKPQRKSLPRLPSQKTSLPKTTDMALLSTQILTKSAAPSTQMESEAGATELGQPESITEIEQVIHPEGGQTMHAKDHEPVTVEQ